MAHTTFRGPNEPAWKDNSQPKGPGPTAADSKVRHSSTGPEREMRKNLTKTEETARQAHRSTDVKDHPSFNNAKPTTRG
jgi:hypothetical protein